MRNGTSLCRFLARPIWKGGNGVDNGDVEILAFDSSGRLLPMETMLVFGGDGFR